MPGADHVQSFVRRRSARIALAVLIIAIAVWAFAPHVGYRTASSAFVNAELVRVTAPIAGRLTRNLPHKGEFIEKPTDVDLIETLSEDKRHLLQLGTQHMVAKRRAELARKQIEAVEAADAALAKRVKVFREGMVARLEHERNETQAEQAGCLAEAHQRRDVGARMEKLVESGMATPIRSSEALATLAATRTRCDMAGVRLERLKTELAAARDGVFLRDGVNDAPYSQQERDRLFMRRQELDTRIVDESLKESQAFAELQEEKKRIERLRHFDLSLPADHVVWSVAASPGSTVSEAQTLLDLASCKGRFVAVELPEREFEQTKVGEDALVRLIGSDQWMRGRIRHVRGSAARTDDRLLAARVPSGQRNSITVEIELPDDALPGRNNFCNIGRLAEVRFHRSGLTFVDSWGRTFRRLADSFTGAFENTRSVSN
jgi:multidrug resistance efflux pump